MTKHEITGELSIHVGDPYEAPHISVFDGKDKVYLHDWLWNLYLEGRTVTITVDDNDL